MKRGFTLIELLASIVVIAIISLVSIPIITGVVNKTKLNALKVSAENLIDATRLYNAQYNNEETVRFDIANNKITSTDTTNLLKYKGSIKAGTVIVDTKGRSVICVTDGSRSAYKNYSENVVSVSNNKTCNIPAGGSIVYLENEATITELSNQELTQKITALETRFAEKTSELEGEITQLKNENKSLKKQVVSVGTIISYSTANVPDGYLKCEGQAVSRTEYAALFEKIGTTYGAGDGSTTFNVPDLRGEFLRGTGTNSHANQGNGASVGVHQDSSRINQPGQSLTTGSGNKIYAAHVNASTGYLVDVPDNSQTITHYWIDLSATRLSGNGSSVAVRPTNTSVLFCIKY